MKIKITIFLILCTLSFVAQNSFQGKAMYSAKTKLDTTKASKLYRLRNKQLTLNIKRGLEKTYTLSFNSKISLFREQEKIATPTLGNQSYTYIPVGKSREGAIFKDIKNKVLVESLEHYGKRFLVTEKLEEPKWILSTETKKIGNYLCYKATMVITDRVINWSSILKSKKTHKKENNKLVKVTAWYAPQIPVNLGPDVYWGLPGLILELNVGRKTILCTEITINPKKDIVIKKPRKGKKVSREEYSIIIKEKTKELRERLSKRK